MGALVTYAWATWLRAALSSDPFVAARLLVWDDQWTTRGRPGSFLPTGHVQHHTACMLRIGHDPAICAQTILIGNSVAPGPISQLLGTFTPPGVKWNGSNVDPRIIILAAGRCNHAGTGTYPWGAPAGNGASIGTEWCGPPADGWPDIVVELRERATAAIFRWNGWGAHQDCTHNEYAPTRKIDPSGRWAAQPTLRQLDPWDGDLWRARLAARLAPAPIPDPVPVEDPVKKLRAHVPTKPSLGEAFVQIEMKGYDSQAQRDVVNDFHDVVDFPCSEAEYNALKRAATAGS